MLEVHMLLLMWPEQWGSQIDMPIRPPFCHGPPLSHPGDRLLCNLRTGSSFAPKDFHRGTHRRFCWSQIPHGYKIWSS